MAASNSFVPDYQAPEGASILLVEDDETDREFMQDLLEEHGYDVRAVGSVGEGIASVTEEVPSAVLCDILLGGDSGYTLFDYFSNDDLLVCVPFLFISGLRDPLLVRHGMQVGADDYITKPIVPADLLVAVRRRILKQRRILGLD